MADEDRPNSDTTSQDQCTGDQHGFRANLTLVELLQLTAAKDERSSEIDLFDVSAEEADRPGFGPIDRERGVLTAADREFLLGIKEFDHRQTYTNTWQRIRDRVTNSLLDFAIIATQIPDDQRERIFDDVDASTLSECLGAIISFMYAGLDRDSQTFEERVADGVFLAELLADVREGRSTGEVRDVDVSITIERTPDVEFIHEKYRDGHPLSDSEVGALVRSGKLSVDELEDFPEFTRLAKRRSFSPRVRRLLEESDIHPRDTSVSEGSSLDLVDNS